MAEKRVSVRLAAVGGKQVKAEFEGIGEAGKRGFGKASREMEIANAKLAKFARRAKIAAGIIAAAAVAAGIASQIFGDRAGLIFTRIDSAILRQATQDVQDFGVAVSESDAAQIQRTNDALSRLGLLWRGIANQLAVAAAPALEAIANAMAVIGKTTGPLGRAIKGLFNHIGEVATIAA